MAQSIKAGAEGYSSSLIFSPFLSMQGENEGPCNSPEPFMPRLVTLPIARTLYSHEETVRMHIGINAQLLSFSQNYRNGGVSRYIRYLLTELVKHPGKHVYTVFVNGQDVVEQLTTTTGTHPQITYVPASWSESQPAMRVVWEQLTLPSLIRQKQI